MSDECGLNMNSSGNCCNAEIIPSVDLVRARSTSVPDRVPQRETIDLETRPKDEKRHKPVQLIDLVQLTMPTDLMSTSDIGSRSPDRTKVDAHALA
jgi:hypothetical protein